MRHSVSQSVLLRHLLIRGRKPCRASWFSRKQLPSKLRLEGSLTDKTVGLLIQRWADVRSKLKDRKAILDLRDVVEVNESGGRTLAWLVGSGASLGYSHPNVCSLVEQLACDEPGALRFAADLMETARFDRLQRASGFDHLPVVSYLICLLLPRALRPCGCRTS